MSKEVARDWTPKKRGEIYCAPACGRGCTWTEYEEATIAATDLSTELGDPWKPRVWENLGWHYEVRRPHLSVSPISRAGSAFHAFLSRDPDGPGGHWVGNGATAPEAVQAVLRLAKVDLENIASLLLAVGEISE